MKIILCAALAFSMISCQAMFAANASTPSRGNSATSEQGSSQNKSGNDPATAKLKQRLAQLKTELAAGQKVLAELEAKAANTRQTMQRISDAIKTLEEELTKSNASQK